MRGWSGHREPGAAEDAGIDERNRIGVTPARSLALAAVVRTGADDSTLAPRAATAATSVARGRWATGRASELATGVVCMRGLVRAYVETRRTGPALGALPPFSAAESAFYPERDGGCGLPGWRDERTDLTWRTRAFYFSRGTDVDGVSQP